MAEASGSGKTGQSYTNQFKKDVVSYAVNHSNRAAASKFNIEPKGVREWRSVAGKFNTAKVVLYLFVIYHKNVITYIQVC